MYLNISFVYSLFPLFFPVTRRSALSTEKPVASIQFVRPVEETSVLQACAWLVVAHLRLCESALWRQWRMSLVPFRPCCGGLCDSSLCAHLETCDRLTWLRVWLKFDLTKITIFHGSEAFASKREIQTLPCRMSKRSMNDRNSYNAFLQDTKQCIKSWLLSTIWSTRGRASGWWSQRAKCPTGLERRMALAGELGRIWRETVLALCTASDEGRREPESADLCDTQSPWINSMWRMRWTKNCNISGSRGRKEKL